MGLPAHVVAGRAPGIEGPGRAKETLVTAIQKDDTAILAKIARFWNTGFDFTTMPKDRSLVITTGPYTLTGLSATARSTSSPQPSDDVAKALLSIDNATVLSDSDGPEEHLDLRFAHSRSETFDDPIVRKAFLKTVPRQKILDELIVSRQMEARLRSSQVFLPGEQGYATSVRKNDSSGYRTVDIEGAKALRVQADVVNPLLCILFDPSNPRRVSEFGAIPDSAELRASA